MAHSGLGDMTSRSQDVFAVVIVFFALTTIFIFARMLSRVWIVRKVSWDDYLMILAWVLAFGMAFSICYGTTVGLGRHEADVADDWQGPLKRSQYAFSVIYNPALMAEKTSILVFYLGLSKTNKIFRWGTIATLFVVNAAGLALTLVTIFQCRPIDADFMTPTPTNAHCTDIITIYLSSAPVNIITDLAILFLPMPILTGMRLPKKQKLILVVTFGFGVFAAIVDIVRIAYLQSASSYRLKELHQENSDPHDSVDQTDFSWYAALSFMWSLIEVAVGIMCGCVPALKPLVSRFLPNLVHDHGVRTNRTNSDHTFRMAEDQRVPSLQDDSAVKEAPPASPELAEEDNSMGMMDFLTTPGMTEADVRDRLQRTQTALTNTSRDTRTDTPTFFDFVNMKGKRSMVQMSSRESIFPIAMVTVLFFIWGFEYGLLNTLNAEFQTVAKMSAGQSVALHSAYYVGYFVGPLAFGRLILKYWGFKACYTVGLAIYACGTLIFWPAAVLTSFPTYVIVNFVVGMGLSILECAANPFIALCGPPQYAEIRLNLSQGFQAIGTVVAPLIAAKAFTKYTTSDVPSLINTQWAYLGIAIFTVLLAVAYYYIPLPEATDAELEDASERVDGVNQATIGSVRVIWIILGLGVFSQFCYVGGQEIVGTEFKSYLAVVEPSYDSTDYMAIAHTVFAVSRFCAAGLGFFVAPRILLLFFYLGAVIFSALAMSFTGPTAVALLIMIFFFEGPLFSLIFAQSLRGMGKHTKMASVLITSAISGGAIFPVLSYVASLSRGTQYSFCVAVAAFAGGLMLPLGTIASPKARRIVDPVRSTAHHGAEGGTRAGAEVAAGAGGGIGGGEGGRVGHSDSSSGRASRALSWLHHHQKRRVSKEADTEWRERRGSLADSP